MTPDSQEFNEEDVRFTHRFLGHSKETEIRLIDLVAQKAKSMFVHGEEEFVNLCRKHSGGKRNVYVGINERHKGGTKKKDVVSVNAMVFDFDAVRDKSKPASEEELNFVREKAREASAYLMTKGLAPSGAESGNGVQLWVKLSCELDDGHREIIEANLQRWQEDLIKRFKDAHVDIDNIGDLPRVVKVIGTKSVKGKQTIDRPHRLSRWIDRPAKVPEADPIWSHALATMAEGHEDDQERKGKRADGEEQEDLNLGKIIEKCKWMNHCQKDSKKLAEPEWFGMLGISDRCKDGRKQSHLLSQDYPTYSHAETERKIDHALKAGPQTCDYVRSNFPKESPGQYCLACPHDITSPIQLGEGKKKRIAGTGNVLDIDTLVRAGHFNREILDKVPAYDQIKDAIERCRDRKDVKMLWVLARAAPHLRVPTLARYAAQEAVLASNTFATEDLAKPEIYYYDDKSGVYRANGRAYIGRLVNRNVPDASAELITTVILKVQAMTHREKEFFLHPANLVCVSNGMLDVKQKRLLPHSPDWFFLSSLNAKYDPDAKCPEIEKFFKQVLLAEDVPTVEEAGGYILESGMPFNVIVFLVGIGRNGKTTMMNVLRTFLGEGAYSARDLHSLSSIPYAKADLYGKMANISAEVSDKPLSHTGILKELSGGDVIDADRKYLSPLRFVNGAKLWFATNALPYTPDISLAFWSRIILIEFKQIFLRENPDTDPYLLAKLTTTEELSGLLNVAISGRQRLLKNKDFSFKKTIDQVQEEWSLASNPVHAWREECCEEVLDATTAKSILYEDYISYCKAKRVRPLADNKFFSQFRQECPRTRDTKLEIKGKRVPSIQGIYLKNRDESREILPRQEVDEPEAGNATERANNPDAPLAPPCVQIVRVENVLYGGRAKKNDKMKEEENIIRKEERVKTTRTTRTEGLFSDDLANPVRVDSPENDSSAPSTTVNGQLDDMEERLVIDEADREETRLMSLFKDKLPFLSGLIDDCKEALQLDGRWGAHQIRAYSYRFKPAPGSMIVEMLANDEKGYQKAIELIAQARLIKAGRGGPP